MSERDDPDDMALWQAEQDARNASLRRHSYAYGPLPSDLDYRDGGEPRHDYPACALFRGGKCTCDAEDDKP